MPKNVRRFEFLMYAALAVVIASFAWEWPVNPLFEYPLVIGVFLLWWSFIIFLIWQAARWRKNWARWVLFSLFILETAIMALSSVQTLAAGTNLQLSAHALEGLAYFFAFTGDARPWFRKGPIGVESVFE